MKKPRRCCIGGALAYFWRGLLNAAGSTSFTGLSAMQPVLSNFWQLCGKADSIIQAPIAFKRSASAPLPREQAQPTPFVLSLG